MVLLQLALVISLTQIQEEKGLGTQQKRRVGSSLCHCHWIQPLPQPLCPIAPLSDELLSLCPLLPPAVAYLFIYLCAPAGSWNADNTV